MNLFKQKNYGSHLAVLVQALLRTQATRGAVAELGTGIYSTPLLHWLCLWQGRALVSYESRAEFLRTFNIQTYHGDGHQVILVPDWDQAQLERPWDVVFIDHEPAERRRVDALRVLDHARLVIVHDSGWWEDRHYDFKRQVWPRFRFRYDYRPTKAKTMTTVLSQTIDLAGFMEGAT
jgi:hypothetical protein